MKHAKYALLLVASWFGVCSCFAKQEVWQKENWLTPQPKEQERQMPMGSSVADDGEAGSALIPERNGWRVASLVPGGPAENAGLARGDLVVAIDGESQSQVAAVMASGRVHSKNRPGDRHVFCYQRAGREFETTVTFEAIRKLYPNIARLPPSVAQLIFGETESWISAAVAAAGEYAQLTIEIRNNTSVDLALNEAQFFILDGNGQALLRPNLNEIKYLFDLLVANHWQGEQYPLPPPHLRLSDIKFLRIPQATTR